MHKLEQYIKENKLTLREFGELIGKSPSYVWFLCQGRVPREKGMIDKIVKATNNYVSTADMFCKVF